MNSDGRFYIAQTAKGRVFVPESIPQADTVADAIDTFDCLAGYLSPVHKNTEETAYGGLGGSGANSPSARMLPGYGYPDNGPGRV
jgi:hypothetical protein